MAFYEQRHVERLLLIKRLQNEKFLPLARIKALLSGQGGADADLVAELHSLVGTPEVGKILLNAEQMQKARAAGISSPAELAVLGQAVHEVGYDFDLAVESFAAYLRHMAALEREEARIVFDRLLRAKNPIAMVETLRRGREVQSRFLAAARARFLEHELEDYLKEIEHSVALSGGPPMHPLSDGLLRRLGYPARAKKLLADSRESPRAARELIGLEYGVGHTETLSELAQKMRQRHGDLGEVILWQGAALVDAGEFEAGLTLLRRSVELIGSGEAAPVAHATLGSALIRRARRTLLSVGTQSAMQEAQAGLAELEKSLTSQPSAFVRYLRGRVYTSMPRFFGHFDSGLADLQAVAVISEGGPDPVLSRLRGNALYFLGVALEQAGRSADSRAALLGAAEVDPEGPLGMRARERLQGVTR
jgi:tetratricopeptide (TPR) repeat protein